MSKVFPRRSTVAWVLLGLYILVYDIIALQLNTKEKGKYETMSDGCWRGIEHPTIRWPIWAAIAILVKHLAAPRVLQKYDPIRSVGVAVNYSKNVGKSGR